MTRPLLLLPLAFAAAVAAADAPPAVPADTLPAALPHDVVPPGLGPRPAAAHPLTAARVALGRRLFFDPILSADRSVACATCHRPDHGFSTPEALPRGSGGKAMTRRPPTLLNRAYGTAFFWDGRAGTLEEQALKPIENPAEMGASIPTAVARLKADPGYAERFATAFDDGVTADNLARALAAFERVLLRADSPVDRFRRGEGRGALNGEPLHGFWIYESKGLCWTCHGGTNFTDEAFHNTGVSWGKGDLGRYDVTKVDTDRGRFKTPTLRGVGDRPPYMHDGSVKTLADVVEFYDRGGVANPHLDATMKPLGLTAEEKKALVAFLKTL